MNENTPGASASPIIRVAAEANLPPASGTSPSTHSTCRLTDRSMGRSSRATSVAAWPSRSGSTARLHRRHHGRPPLRLPGPAEAALERIGSSDRGVVVYLRRGRGIGLVNKIRAYALQDTGLDTVEANHRWASRTTCGPTRCAAIIQHLGIESVHLLSNNPNKRAGLEANGVRVEQLVPHRMRPNAHNAFYLDTKKRKSGHLL